MAKQRMAVPYTQDIAEIICDRVAGGENLSTICEDPVMPQRSVVRQWESKNEEFCSMLEVARRYQADAHFDMILRIAMDIPDVPEEPTAAEVSAYRAHLAVAAFQIDTLKWIAARLDPTRYSDRASARRPKEQSIDFVTQLTADIRARNPHALEEFA